MVDAAWCRSKELNRLLARVHDAMSTDPVPPVGEPMSQLQTALIRLLVEHPQCATVVEELQSRIETIADLVQRIYGFCACEELSLEQRVLLSRLRTEIAYKACATCGASSGDPQCTPRRDPCVSLAQSPTLLS